MDFQGCAFKATDVTADVDALLLHHRHDISELVQWFSSFQRKEPISDSDLNRLKHLEASARRLRLRMNSLELNLEKGPLKIRRVGEKWEREMGQMAPIKE